ncbi:MAG: PA14 domain-containing protein, partial [Verrucomicrobiota bacterium]
AGLPPGVIINPDTGTISGTLTSPVVTTVEVTVSDESGGEDRSSFTWTVTAPSPGGSTPGLRYEYFNREVESLPEFSTLTPDKTGVVANLDLSPRTRDDAFLFRFFGEMTIPAGGNYTFHLTSDDGSALWIDGVKQVDNDGLHGEFTESETINLSAGRHSIEVGYLEFYGGETLVLEVEGPGLSRQIVPSSWFSHGGSAANLPPQLLPVDDQLSAVGNPVSLTLSAFDPNADALTFEASNLPAGLTINPSTGVITGTPSTAVAAIVVVTVTDGNGGGDSETFTWTVTDPAPGGGIPGLYYEYFNVELEQVPDFSKLTPDKTGTIADFDLSPRTRDDAFAFRFFGDIAIAQSGDYTFSVTSDDGSRLWIDGQLVVNNDGLHGDETKSGTINLSAGSHVIEVAYFEFYGGETLIVEIEGPGLTRQRVPTTLLSHQTENGTPGGSEANGKSGRSLYTDSSSTDESILVRRYQPDNWIAKKGSAPIGNNVFNDTGQGQTLGLKFTKRRAQRVEIAAQNDRLVEDELTFTATRPNRAFRVRYRGITHHFGNPTASILTSGLKLHALRPGGRALLEARISPDRKFKRSRARSNLSFRSTSAYRGLKPDKVNARLLKKL